MIIIEGADLVGKTTLCHKLLETEYCQKNGMVYSHLSRLPPGWRNPGSYLARACSNTVQDRFHLSEPVYAAVRGEETRLTPERYRLVDAWLRLMGAITVVVVTDDKILESRWREGEMYDLAQVKKANALFMRAVAERDRPFIDYRIDFDLVITSDALVHNSPRIVQSIVDLHAHRKHTIKGTHDQLDDLLPRLR